MTRTNKNKFSLNVALVLLATTTLAVASNGRKTYSGFTVYRGLPTTGRQVDALKQLHSSSKLLHDGEIEFWRTASSPNRPVDIMATPGTEDKLKAELQGAGVKFDKIVKDLEKVIRHTSKSRHGILRKEKTQEELLNSREFYKNFQSYSMIEAKLRALAKSDPRFKLQEIGKSYEKRPIYLVKISSKPASNKSVILIDAGHHAREWATHSTIIYILESILGNILPTKPEFDKYTHDVPSLNAQLEKYDYWIVPVVNPDGYEYSRKFDRKWRKTRSHNDSPCVGTDPNRNYPFMWRSSVPCNAMNYTYSGPTPLSEPEVKAVSDVILNSNGKISMYISLHSYGGLILMPYGYAAMDPPNIDELIRVAEAGANAMLPLRNIEYIYGSSAKILYDTAGASDDYAYAVGKIKFSYTFEIAECEKTAFLMPATEIVTTAQETTLGIAAMVKAI